MTELYMKIFDKIISIEAEGQSAIDDIYNTFSFFLVESNAIQAEINIIIEDNDANDYRIVYDDKVSACAKVNLYPKLCDIIRRAIILKTNLFCFHAAAVEKDGKAYIFVFTGNSGCFCQAKSVPPC